jgi:hypothetical protein
MRAVLVLPIGVVVSFVGSLLTGRLSGSVSHPLADRWSTRSTPRMGGWGLLGCFLFANTVVPPACWRTTTNRPTDRVLKGSINNRAADAT